MIGSLLPMVEIRPEQLFNPSSGSATLGSSAGAKGKTLTYPHEE